MPELPDVELFKRCPDANALHREIAKGEVVDPFILQAISAADFREKLKRACLEGCRRRGKRLLARLDHGRLKATEESP